MLAQLFLSSRAVPFPLGAGVDDPDITFHNDTFSCERLLCTWYMCTPLTYEVLMPKTILLSADIMIMEYLSKVASKDDTVSNVVTYRECFNSLFLTTLIFFGPCYSSRAYTSPI